MMVLRPEGWCTWNFQLVQCGPGFHISRQAGKLLSQSRATKNIPVWVTFKISRLANKISRATWVIRIKTFIVSIYFHATTVNEMAGHMSRNKHHIYILFVIPIQQTDIPTGKVPMKTIWQKKSTTILKKLHLKTVTKVFWKTALFWCWQICGQFWQFWV